VDALRSKWSLTPASLAAEIGFARSRVDAAVESLVLDGLLEFYAGRVRLAGS
jgi:hypothetical protein